MDGPQRNDYKADFLREVLQEVQNESGCYTVQLSLLLEILDPDNNVSRGICKKAIRKFFNNTHCYYVEYCYPSAKHYYKNAEGVEESVREHLISKNMIERTPISHYIEVRLVKDPNKFIYIDGELPQFISKKENKKVPDRELKKSNYLNDFMRITGLDDFQIQIIFGDKKTAKEMQKEYEDFCKTYNLDPLRGYEERPAHEYYQHCHCKYWRERKNRDNK